jgi:predicted ribosomally synthesized peptide with SipW-like signal peptide
MNDDRLELTRRKILAGAGAVGLAGAGAGLGSSAFFSDQETFTNNQLVAGSLDMKVAWSEHYSDWMGDETNYARMPGPDEDPSFRLPAASTEGRPIELVLEDPDEGDEETDSRPDEEDGGRQFYRNTRVERDNGGVFGGDLCGTDADVPDEQALIDLDDVKPGDFGFAIFRFQLCDNPGQVWLTGGLESAMENGITEPEGEDEDEYGDADATNPALVELLDEIQVAFGVGTTNDLAADQPENLFPEDEAVEGAPQPAEQMTLREFLKRLACEDGIPLEGDIDAEEGGGTGRDCFSGEMAESGEGHYASVVWWLPVDHANEIQTDSATFDLGFYTEQCRHNGRADRVVSEGESIQQAIDAADPGDEIVVESGRYEAPSDGLEVDVEGLTLRSVGTRARIVQSETGTNSTAVSIEADDVTFERFEVTNPDGLIGISVDAPSSGVTVRNNHVHDVGPVGALGVTGIVTGANGTHENLTVEKNLVEDLRSEIDDTSGYPTVNGILVDQPGIVDSTIADNVVRGLESDIAPLGIVLNADATNVSVEGNYVTNLLAAHAVDSDDSDDAAGEFTTYAQGINITSPTTQTVDVVENTITDLASEDGYVAEAVKIDGDASGVALNRNNLLAPVGVNNDDNNTLDAECNWWGSPAGPEEASQNPPQTTDEDRRDVIGPVDYDPWLVESYDEDADISNICSGGT